MRNLNIVLLGSPGSGKGTQAELICKEFKLPHISTGDIFRYNIANGTELGKRVQSIIAKGELVPDDLTISIVEDRLRRDDCQNGFVLDGFPRNLAQAEALDRFSDINLAIMVDLADEIIVERLSKRRMCKDCKNPTMLDWLVDGKCEKCGGEVFIRADDEPQTIQTRLKNQKTPQNVIDHYKNKNVYHVVSSLGEKEEVFSNIKNLLQRSLEND